MSMGGFVALIAFGEKLSLPRAQIRPGIRPTLDNDTPYPTADIELQRRQGGGGGGRDDFIPSLCSGEKHSTTQMEDKGGAAGDLYAVKREPRTRRDK
jgi:hypothetical protein